MRINSVLLISCICIISSCHRLQNNQDGMKYVTSIPSLDIDTLSIPLCFDLRTNIEKNIYENIDSIRIIPLKTTGESLIGKTSDIRLIQSKIVVTDLYKSKSIFVFDMDGHFLYKIGTIGQGPGEYLSLNSVHVSDEYIDILDWIGWKHIRYDINGSLKEEHLLKEQSPSDIFKIDQENWLLMYQQYSSDFPYRLVFTDSIFHVRETALPFTNDRKFVRGKFRQTIQGDLLYSYFRFLSVSDQERIYKHIKNEADIVQIKRIGANTDDNPVICLFHSIM